MGQVVTQPRPSVSKVGNGSRLQRKVVFHQQQASLYLTQVMFNMVLFYIPVCRSVPPARSTVLRW